MTDTLIFSPEELTERSLEQEGLATMIRDCQSAERFLLVNLLLALDGLQGFDATRFLNLMTVCLPGIEQESDRIATEELIQECLLALSSAQAGKAH